MTGDGQDGRRTRGGRRARTSALATAAMAVALAGGACAGSAEEPDIATGGDVGEFAATPEYLAGVADATEGLTYRISADMTMRISAEGQGLEMGGTFMTGEVDGDMSAMTMDFGEVFDDMAGQGVPAELLDGDLTMEMVTDGTTGYMRAPYFGTMVESNLAAGASPSDLGPLADLAEVSDEWGRIDLSAVSPSEAAAAAGAQSSDPRVFLELAATGTDVHDLGTETIDGVDARGLGATVTYGDMLEAQGIDSDEFRDRMASAMGAGGDEAAETFGRIMGAMLDADAPIEVWVDGDDRVRRISFALDMSEIMADVAADTGENVGDIGMSVDTVMDFSDYGDESIEIEVPTDAVDITDEYLAFIESGGVGTGTAPLPS